MQEIKLWMIDKDDPKHLKATPVNTVGNTETEEQLEEVLVATPDLLMEGLSLVGRQVDTQGGPLDLLGIDQDGHVAIFELKKGTLTREAVAQVIDYASDIAQLTKAQFARLVEESSGRLGVDEIGDFVEWYDEHYPDEEGVNPRNPKMVLVGLGADDRARRMVSFLASSGVDVELITFQGFEQDGRQFIARQAETQKEDRESGISTKARNKLVLEEEARKLKVGDLLKDVADFLSHSMPAYQWVGTTSYSYHLTETSDTGRPTQRAYVSLRLNYKKPGELTLVLYERALKGIEQPPDQLMAQFSKEAWAFSKYKEIEVEIDQQQWPGLKPCLQELLELILQGWREKTRVNEAEVGK